MDRLTIRIDTDTKAKLNQIAYRKGYTLSEAIRELIHRENGADPYFYQIEALKKLLLPLAVIDLNLLLYHIARASVAPVAAAQMTDRIKGDLLNETVKSAAEKIAARMITRVEGN